MSLLDACEAHVDARLEVIPARQLTRTVLTDSKGRELATYVLGKDPDVERGVMNLLPLQAVP